MSQPDYYPPRGSRPAGQGYYPSYPSSGSDERNDRGRGPRQRQQHQAQPYFEPPPTAAYDDQYIPYDQYPQHLRQSEHFPDYPDYGAAPPDPRPQQHRPAPTEYFDRAYAPSSDPGQQQPTADPAGALTPYDEEKAEAEWRRGVEEAYTYQRSPPPPTAYCERQAYEDDLMREQRERERDRNERERERERRYFEERERQRERSRERERRRRRDEDSLREKALGYPSDPKKGGRDVFGSSEGERGLAAKLAGGAGGAWIAHEVTDNVLGTLGGLVVGAIAASTIEKQHEKRQNRKYYGARRASDASYARTDKYGEAAYPAPGRNMDDVRRTGRDGSRDEVRERDRRERRRSQSFVSRMKDQVRSLSRKRAPSRPQAPRRRSSYDSYDSHDSHDSMEIGVRYHSHSFALSFPTSPRNPAIRLNIDEVWDYEYYGEVGVQHCGRLDDRQRTREESEADRRQRRKKRRIQHMAERAELEAVKQVELDRAREAWEKENSEAAKMAELRAVYSQRRVLSSRALISTTSAMTARLHPTRYGIQSGVKRHRTVRAAKSNRGDVLEDERLAHSAGMMLQQLCINPNAGQQKHT